MKFDASKPLYRQIYDYYLHLLKSGAFQEGQMLPSVREVATAFSINPLTVMKAYEELVKDGYIYSVYKKGYFVKDSGGNGTKLKEEIQRLLSLGYSLEEIIEVSRKLKEETDDKN